MIISRIEASQSKRYKVYSDAQYLFALYGKELKRYHIEEGVEVADSAISIILETVIYKRAKERALFFIRRKTLFEANDAEQINTKRLSKGYC